MYPDVCLWLRQFLESHFRNANIEVYDLSKSPLSRFISTHDVGEMSPEWVTWDIRVDVVGFIRRPGQLTSLAFVECKNTHLTLAHFSQLLGYSRVAFPRFSFLISPLGLSPNLTALLRKYRRLDILEYHWPKGESPKQVVVAKWDTNACNIDRANTIPRTGL